MPRKNFVKKVKSSGLAIILLLCPILLFGWNTSVQQIPNGKVFMCNNCHLGSGINFKRDFRNNGEKWDESLAAIDSDGDGFKNGIELQDPDGLWREGQSDPGDSDRVTNPGNPASFPQETQTPNPTSTPTPTATPSSGVQKIEIRTDKKFYQDKEVIKLYLTLYISGDAFDVDIYIVLVNPSIEVYFFPSWSNQVDNINGTIPNDFRIDDVLIMTFDIPNILPPINVDGRYTFYFALAEPGTANFLGGIAQTSIEVFSRCPPDMVNIPEGEFIMGDFSGWGFEDELPAHSVKLGSYCIDKF